MELKKGDRVVVTSALPYVNGIKHLGNLVGSMLPADVYHRFLDLMGIDNIYICATDEHGTPCEVAAMKEGMSPEEYSEKYHRIQKEIYEKWMFDFSIFGRTSSEYNRKMTQEFFMRMWENGFVSEKTLKMPFCLNDQRFLPDRFIEGTCPHCGYESARGDQCEKCGKLLNPEDLLNPHCVICGKSDIEFREEKHLFLELGKLENDLKQWILSKDWPANVKNFALGWIKEGLKERCITRNLKWGIPVPLPEYSDKVFYVWFDAPIGYVGETMHLFNGDREKMERYWKEGKIIHFLGKDNIPFHTIFWPGMILASGGIVNLPDWVQGYEYLNWEGQKFSTSKKRGLFSDQALEIFPADYWRFYLMSILPESHDSNFSWDQFRETINMELLGNYANLFYRTVTFIDRHFSGIASDPSSDPELKREAEALKRDVWNLMENVKLREILRRIMDFSSLLNRYFQKNEPWELVKSDREKAHRILTEILNYVRFVSQLLEPFVPGIAGKALKIIGKREGWENLEEMTIRSGHRIGKPEMLVRKIPDEEIERLKEKYGGRKMAFKPEIEYGDFQRLDIRIAEVLDVRKHPNADKLYILRLKVGGEERQIVSGLVGYYSPEELKGMKIAYLANLKPRKIRGELSQGMLLAAESSGSVSVLTPDSRKPVDDGAEVH